MRACVSVYVCECVYLCVLICDIMKMIIAQMFPSVKTHQRKISLKNVEYIRLSVLY